MYRNGAKLIQTTIFILTITLGAGGCSRVSVTPGTERPKDEDSPPHWAYEGEMGPSNWGDEYPDCAGAAQSPIDISATAHADLPALEFVYPTIEGTLAGLDHALQVNTEGGALAIGDSTYTLRQLHFHVPSEHTIEGRRFDAVMHLVHAGEGGRLAVVAVLYEVGGENKFIGEVLEAAAAPDDEQSTIEIDIEGAAPENTEYFTYNGSLTTPPCAEGVRWFVLRNPISLTQEQLTTLAGHFRDNVRPIQPANDRPILHSPG